MNWWESKGIFWSHYYHRGASAEGEYGGHHRHWEHLFRKECIICAQHGEGDRHCWADCSSSEQTVRLDTIQHSRSRGGGCRKGRHSLIRHRVKVLLGTAVCWWEASHKIESRITNIIRFGDATNSKIQIESKIRTGKSGREHNSGKRRYQILSALYLGLVT